VNERATHVEIVLSFAEDVGHTRVHDQSDCRDRDHNSCRDRTRVEQALHCFDDEHDDDAEHQQAVERRADHLGTREAVRMFESGWPPREPCRRCCKPERERIREHVAGVARQRKRARPESRPELDQRIRQRDDERDDERRRADLAIVSMVVVVVVVVRAHASGRSPLSDPSS
jgi:hypothetical protein